MSDNFGKKLNSDYPSGFYVDPPKSANAPDWVVGAVGINLSDFQDWLSTMVKPGTDRVNFDICKKKDGTGWYCKRNTFVPKSGAGGDDDDLPF